VISQKVQRLREIRTFPSLVKYLRDELDWPIESDDFDDLTFDYEPEELGIDAKTAVKIKEIKQLRPLSSKQPWGIFFINFEPKQLPIVVLRRILRSLVINKRASANKSQQAVWNFHDLLFISSYGESEHREITFAHFSEPADRLFGDLPTLRVLGWDDDDTKLKIDHVVHTLDEKMRWPDDEDDAGAWRKKWSDAFELRPREVITTSKELAIRLADLAKSIRQRANLILKIESERGPLRKLHKAFQTALIHDLNEDDFADMYAQTIAYGLLAARVSRPAGVIADNLADMVPITNPFLKEMLGTFLKVGGRKGKIDFDELGIQEVVDLLNRPDTHIEAVMRDFGKKTMQEDPVVHFYELFLKEYDKKKKVERGVFYTPQPVVYYIVRSVDELLKTEFGLEDGLASTVTWGEMVKRNPELKIPDGVAPDEPFVLILDPATGTATFIVEVIDVIHKTMIEKWKKAGKTEAQIQAAWNEYVPKHLLPRVYGYELMMAPYAIAHMKVGLKLFETGYRFGSDERVHIYLTNSLEPPSNATGQKEFDEWFPALAHEAKAVNAVKSKKRFTVVVGNPPYSYDSENTGEWIETHIRQYYQVDGVPLGERNPKGLQDDYVKFIRFSEFSIEKTGYGILAFITNHGYIDNPTFRGMRKSLMDTFGNIYVLDLHGNAKKKEKCPDGSKDENVFDIQQGVAIGIFVKQQGQKPIQYAGLWGLRDGKYKWLWENENTTTTWQTLKPQAPHYLFVPQGGPVEEYQRARGVTDIYINSANGFKTHRDHFAVAFDKNEMDERIATLLNAQISNADLIERYHLVETIDWKLQDVRKALKTIGKLTQHIVPCLYRPLDIRYCLFGNYLMDRPREAELSHVLSDNLCFATGRQGQAVGGSEWNLLTVGKYVADTNLFYRGGIQYFPLYLYPQTDFEKRTGPCRRPNLAPEFIKDFSNRLGMKFITNGKGDKAKTFGPADVFDYMYAVFHSPGYRTRYAEFLKIDFPRLPLTSSLDLFQAIGKFGGELVALHLMESPKLDKHITRFVGKGTPVVEKVSYSDETAWIDKAKSQGFQGVPENVWNFHIGGYQVCEKWLKDRGPKSGKPGRTLSADDINHYHRIVVALNETIRLMAEIDKVIDQHGGWPNAFLDIPKRGC